MSLTIYNSIWGFVKFILEPYLERRVKKGKEDVHRINENELAMSKQKLELELKRLTKLVNQELR